jgi:S-adenosyl methyltransferase
VPNVARIYDYILGGKDNFAADRRAAQQLRAALPDIAGVVRDNRSFIGRVVRFMTSATDFSSPIAPYNSIGPWRRRRWQ